MDKKDTILFVVAHPDDLAHSMGGTAWLLHRSYDLHVLCLTKGERGIDGASLDEAGKIREKEEAAACDILGAELTFLEQTNGDTFADRETCEKVAAIMRDKQPVAVFTLWPINHHPDHTTVYEIAIKALHLADHYYHTEVYMVENGMGVQTNQFEPDIYIDITDVIDYKREQVRCHMSQNKDEAGVERVLDRNRFRGKLAGCEFAEPFKTIFAPTVNGSHGRMNILRSLGNGA